MIIADYNCTLTGPCHTHADCIQQPESHLWTCQCRTGFTGNGIQCEGM